mmetsp:Transcript_36865/g.61046  ORF Transcript_36865/g.61046 Transcript_36865/m.61046 type:complete len:350 (+) Transcript_36865:427-1476(+)
MADSGALSQAADKLAAPISQAVALMAEASVETGSDSELRVTPISPLQVLQHQLMLQKAETYSCSHLGNGGSSSSTASFAGPYRSCVARRQTARQATSPLRQMGIHCTTPRSSPLLHDLISREQNTSKLEPIVRLTQTNAPSSVHDDPSVPVTDEAQNACLHKKASEKQERVPWLCAADTVAANIPLFSFARPLHTQPRLAEVDDAAICSSLQSVEPQQLSAEPLQADKTAASATVVPASYLAASRTTPPELPNPANSHPQLNESTEPAAPLYSLSVVEVCITLIALNFEHYAENFRRFHVTGDDLLEADNADLLEIGMTLRLHRKRLLRHRDVFAATGVPLALCGRGIR